MDNMRISNIFKTYGAYESSPLTSSSKTNPKQVKKDTFALSSQAKDYQVAAKAATTVPDIRQDKIASIKAQIENGTYSVDTSLIADKMMQKFFM